MSDLVLLFNVQINKVEASASPTPPPPSVDDAMLLETGDYMLLETGDYMLLE